PSLILICIYALINNYIKQKKISIKVFLWIGSPFLISFLIINLFSIINMLKYNSYDTVDIKNKQFVRAYASLLRIKPEKPLPYIPVSKATREQLYIEIPSFRELKETETSFEIWAPANPY